MTGATLEGRAKARPRASAAAVTDGFRRLFHLEHTQTVELILVCEAEPEGLPGADTGLDGPPLSEKGRYQAHRLAMRLRRMHLGALISSTRRSAVETAGFIAAAKDLPIIRAHQLREIEYTGDGADADGDEGQKRAAEVAIRFLNHPQWESLRGVEPARRFRERVAQAMHGIRSHHAGQRVVVVTHAGVINAYLCALLGTRRDMLFLPEYASITVVRALDELAAIQRVNDFAHLLPTFNPR